MDSAYSGDVTGSHSRQIGWLILVLLLFFRIPYTIAIIYLLPIENQNGSAFYEVGTYFLICFLIWWEHKRIEEFHIDTAALFLIIFIRPVQTLILKYWGVDSPLAFPRLPGLALWIISVGLLIALWQAGFKPVPIRPVSLLWLLVGISVGLCLSIAENAQTFQSLLSSRYSSHMQLSTVLSTSGLNLLYHLGFAPINEEPLFRGFLWGYLRQLRWKDVWIWLLQAALFTSAHVYIARQSLFMFWIFIPIAALLLGLLAWRSRSVAPGILSHALVNGSIYFLLAALVLHALN